MATKRSRWVLIALACAIAVIVCLVGPRYGPVVWEWAVYGDWRPLELPLHLHGRRSSRVAGPDEASVRYVKLKEKRFSWLPGQEVKSFACTKEEYECLLTESVVQWLNERD